MQNLVIDIGNTSSKTAVFEDGKLVGKKQFEQLSINNIKSVLETYPDISKCILSNVGQNVKDLESLLLTRCNKYIQLSGSTPVPVKILYQKKATLGSDRIAVIAGANQLAPDTELLVIDAGSAITFERISSANEYLGGNISPGLIMRYKALHKFTRKLPFLNPEESSQWGTDTFSAIRSGVQNSVIYEIDSYIESFVNEYVDGKVYLTGGDAFFLENKIKNSIFVNPDLVLIGLNCILAYNE
jgi:type III pantothenate kinase